MFSKLAEALSRRQRELTEVESSLRLEQHKPEEGTTEMQYNLNIIEDRPTPTPLQGYVTNFTKNGAAFVREFDSNRDIFVPVTIVEKTGLNRGDRVFAMAVPNKLYETWRPELGVMRPAELFAIHVMNAHEYEQMAESAQSDEVIEEPSLEDRILELLKHGPASASEVTRILGDAKIHQTFDSLCNLHKDGHVARATIKQRADQKNASFVIWALDRKELIPPMSTEPELEF